jgi:hypothetical protein
VSRRWREAITSARASALEIAVATSSVKSPTRASVSAGNGSGRVVDRGAAAVIKGPSRDRRHGTVGLEALHARHVGVAQQSHLARDGLEDRVGGDPLGDQRRHSPQRRLLIREPPLRGPGLLGLVCARGGLLGADVRAPAELAHDVRRAERDQQRRARPGVIDREAAAGQQEEDLERQIRGEGGHAGLPETPADRDGKDREQVQARRRHRVHDVLQRGDRERDGGDRERAGHQAGRRAAALKAQRARRATAGASATAAERRRPRAPARLR